MDERYFATCARGLEPVLVRELEALGALKIEAGRGGVQFAGPRSLVMRANLWLRTAVRVLLPILEAEVRSTDELYEAVQTLDWAKFMTTAHTLAVDSNVRDSAITHSKYAALRVKDAICDQFVARTGARPSVDTEEPMVPLNLHIHANRMVLSLDSSGDSLHRRGYRPIQLRAPINEALAAGIVLLTGWNGSTPFADPLCGSGTIPIEAAWIALKRPPGLTRKRFGFVGWMDHDRGEWAALRDEARQAMLKSLPAPILGSDERTDAVEHARQNARAAGIGHALDFQRTDFRHVRLPETPGVVLCNPPYGERIGEEKDLIPLYRAIGDLARRSPGWRVWVFTGNERLGRSVGLPPRRVLKLFNGKIPCQLLEFAA